MHILGFLSPPADITHRIVHAMHSVWDYVRDPTKLRSSVGDKIFAALFGSLATVWTYTKTHLWSRLLSLARLFRSRLTGQRYVLVWLDADHTIALRLVRMLGTKCTDSDVRLLSAPKDILNYPLHPKNTEALVFLDTDVTKLSSDDTLRKQIETKLRSYLTLGGGVVGSHDIIYRRTRAEVLTKAFGGTIQKFVQTTQPVKYKKTSEHPICVQMESEEFLLNDGELLWTTWEEEAQVIFASDDIEARPLVVARSHGGIGRLVWLHSCDQQQQLAKAINVPEENFVKLLSASVQWVAGHKWRLDAYPYVVAHRGASESSRENTIEAFEQAVRFGADFVECDIRRTSDGVCILNHDPTIGSLSISSSTFAALDNQGHELGFQVARLDEFIRTFRGRIRVDFELKEQGYERIVVKDLLTAGWRQSSFVITSFYDDSILAVKNAAPDVKCGLLLGKDKPAEWLKTRIRELFPVKRLRHCGADFVAPNLDLLNFWFAKRVTSAGFPIWVWTVNKPHAIQKLMQTRRIEAVITDFPALGCQARKAFHSDLASRMGGGDFSTGS